MTKIFSALPYPVKLLLLTGLYILSSKIGLSVEVEFGGISSIWPPSGLALAVFLRGGMRYWPMVLLGEFYIGLQLGQTPLAGAIGGVAQLLEASLGCYFLRLRAIDKITATPNNLLWFTAFGCIIPPLVAATIGATALYFLNLLDPSNYSTALITWWLGDTVAILVLTPFLADLSPAQQCKRSNLPGYLSFMAAAILVSLLITTAGGETGIYFYFVLVPFVALSAFYFGLLGAGSATIALTVLVFLQPSAPAHGDLLTAIRMTFAAMCGFTGYLIAALMEKRTQDQLTIEHQNNYLCAFQQIVIGLIRQLDPEQLLKTIVDKGCELVATDSGYFSKNEPGRDSVIIHVGCGLFRRKFLGYEVAPGVGVAGTVWQTRQPLLVNDYQNSPLRHPDPIWDSVSAIIGVPVKLDNGVTGVLGVLSTDPARTFTDDDLQVIRQLSKLASVVWKNAETHAELSRQLSARTKAETNLRQLQLAIENTAEDVMITDPNGEILYVNPAFEQHTGYSRQEVLGKSPQLLKSGAHDAAFYQDLWQTIRDGNIWRGQLQNRKKDGSIILQETSIAPFRDGNHQIAGYVSVKRDVTEHERIKGELEQAKKLEAIGTMARGIAHDFNNIIASICGHAELALHYHLAPEHPVADNFRQILKVGNRAAEIVNQILIYCQSSEIALCRVDVLPIAREICKTIRAPLPPEVSLHLDCRAAHTTILATPSFVHQVLLNLITNGVQALPDSRGNITVTLTNQTLEAADGASGLPGSVQPKGLLLEVHDDGVGMNAETIDKIFEPYFTTKGGKGGTGLGLSVVHGIVKKLGSSIDVRSTPGNGTTFTILFAVDAGITTEKTDVYQDPPQGTESILVVDDDSMLAEVTLQMLSLLGYQVRVFTDSIKALTHVQNEEAQYDIVILDMSMPNLNGLELSRDIRRKCPDIPIILSTGDTTAIDRDAVAETGISEIVAKPFALSKIAKVIRTVLDEKPSR